jgi:hypothetical protein
MVKSDLMAAALGYGQRGWRVLPIRKDKKTPYIKNWQHAATIDADQITEWWKQWSDANVGILTGAESGIFVVDVDGELGAASLAAWVEEFNWDIVTLTAKTGRGTHFYFKHPGGTIKTRVGIRPGIDVRGDGGYVVAPPSVHSSGSIYEFVSEDVVIASAPQELVDLIANGGEALEKVKSTEDRTDCEGQCIPEGQRNTTLFKRACSMQARGLESQDIDDELSRVNDTQCVPPLPVEEVEAIAQSVQRYPKGSTSTNRAHDSNALFFWPLDVNGFLSNRDLMFMTDAQRGRYVMLLAEAWRGKGTLPNDQHKLFILSRATCSEDEFRKELPFLMGPFDGYGTDSPDLIHRPMQALWEKKFQEYEQKKEAGRKSAEARKARGQQTSQVEQAA